MALMPPKTVATSKCYYLRVLLPERVRTGLPVLLCKPAIVEPIPNDRSEEAPISDCNSGDCQRFRAILQGFGPLTWRMSRPVNSMAGVDIRIGVTYSPREIDLQLPEDSDQDDIRKEIEAVLAGDDSILWLTDRRGKVVGVPSSKLAYVEIGADSDTPSIGFGS